MSKWIWILVAALTLLCAGSVAEAESAPRDAIARKTVVSMQGFGRRYPHAGYGGKFSGWLRDLNPRPYNSWGNGSAMRVSPVGWVAGGVEQAELLAEVLAV